MLFICSKFFQNKFNAKIFFLLFTVLIWTQSQVNAQSYEDLSGVRVEELTDDQIRKLINEANRAGLNQSSLEPILIQRGMSPVEMAKLKVRIQEIEKNKLNSNFSTIKQGSNQTRQLSDSMLGLERKPLMEFNDVIATLKSRNFGYQVFNNPRISFEPSLDIPTPKNYQLSTNDELIINVSGNSEANYALKVTPDGVIRIPVAGPVYVNGLTIEQADKAIVKKLSATIYTSIKNGRTKVDVTLGRIRSIKVIVIGEAFIPGTYTLPSLATAFHALYACGGPGPNGSFRNIQIVRNSKIISELDIYDYLVTGNKINDIRLMDQDVIKINSYEKRIELKGEIKKQGLYDVVKGETLGKIISYAGGFTDQAYTNKIQVFRNTPSERKISTISFTEIESIIPEKGDSYVIGKILNRFANRISLKGAVNRPGEFELKEGMTLADLIIEAEGLREDAFIKRGNIHRLKPDLSPEIISFDLEKIISDPSANILLKKEDKVNIYSKFDLKEAFYVKIDGEVLSPGIFLFEEGMKVQDLIMMAGGLKESSSLQKVEISRRIKDSIILNAEEVKTALIFQQDITASLTDSTGSRLFALEPFDEVVIRPAPGYYTQKNVVIEGEIIFKGKYTLEEKNEKISDLVKRAGGITPEAYLKGAVLVRTRNFTRTEISNYQQGLKNLVKQNLESGISIDLIQAEVTDIIQKKSDFVGINLEEILDNPGSKYDLFLNDGDTLRIPKQLQTVRVSGEVLYPTLVRFDQNLNFKKYINNSGGFSDRASRKNSYVVHPNGSVAGTKNFLFIKNYPSINPGSEIYVPAKRQRERMGAGAIISIAATLVTMLAVVFTIIK